MTNELKDILLQVERPARYVGGEFNLPDMQKACKERVCMCFSDKYEIGMSNIGIRILYHMLNDMDDVVCERCFAPDLDLAKLLKEHNMPLFSIETKKDLKEFDIVGFSVQFELQYTNVAYMFDLANTISSHNPNFLLNAISFSSSVKSAYVGSFIKALYISS